MLQKYHPNPLSHFLALHNSQATHHNVVDAHTLASTLANGHVQFQQQHHHQQQQHQQQQFPNPAILANHQHPHSAHNQIALELATQHLNSQNSPTHAMQRDHHSPLNNQILQPQQQQQRSSQHQIQNHYHHHHTQQLIEAAAAANTTLDAGKSFTIAAILGLQKSAMENTRKEYTNNVINLSLNGANHHHHQQIPTCSNNTTPPLHEVDEPNHHQQHHPQQLQQIQRNSLNNCNNNHNNYNNNNNNNDNEHKNRINNNNSNNNKEIVSKSNICNSFINTSNINNNNSNNTNIDGSSCNINTNSPLNNPVNNFNCDNTTTSTATSAVTAATVLMNRYLPSAMANVASSNVVASTQSLASFASSPVMTHQQHVRANSFVAAAAAAAAAAAVNGGPSALQSLQQLHQQHAHQTSLSFQREKLKSDHNGKKSSLKNKRVRTIFTPEQLERLEAEFERQQYMVGPERLYLAHTLSLTEAQVKVWFQNRRIKWRKHHLEMTQQRLALLRQTQIATNPSGNNDSATINIDTNEDECDDIKREELRELNESRQDTESELSICNDSVDAGSIIDGDDET